MRSENRGWKRYFIYQESGIKEFIDDRDCRVSSVAMLRCSAVELFSTIYTSPLGRHICIEFICKAAAPGRSTWPGSSIPCYLMTWITLFTHSPSPISKYVKANKYSCKHIVQYSDITDNYMMLSMYICHKQISIS